MQAGVHEHAHLHVDIAPPEAKDVIAEAERLEVAGGQGGQRLADGDGVAVDGAAVLVLVTPRVGRSVVGVRVALEARLVPVVDAGHARQRHLQERGEPETAHGHPAVVLVQAEAVAPVVIEALGRRGIPQDREQADPVVAPQQVEGAVGRVVWVVLVERLQGIRQLAGAHMVGEVALERMAQGVVHGAVELAPLKVVAQATIGDLVGRVLPHLADEQGIRLLGQGRRLDVGYELVGQLVGDVQAPAAGTQAQPLAHDAVTPADELAELGAVLVHVGQVVDAPPALIAAIVVEGEPVPVARVLAHEGAVGVVSVLVEVEGVCPHMVEDPVEDDGYATGAGLRAEAREGLLVAQHGIDPQVVGRVVAMAGGCLEDGVKVDDRDAHGLEVGQLLAYAIQGSPVEVPDGDASIGCAVIAGIGAPVLDQPALGTPARRSERGRDPLLPPLPTGKAIREDLVGDATLVPLGQLGAQPLEDGDLERGGSP